MAHTQEASKPSPVSSATSNPRKSTETAAVQGASLLISLQIASRALTFLANQLLLRYLTAALLGLSAQLEVYYLSILFFAREGLRIAVQRQKTTSQDTPDSANRVKKNGYQAVVNLGYLAILLGIGVAPGLAILYLSSVDDSTRTGTPYFVMSLRLYGVAAVLELLSEPVFVLLQVRLQFGTRAIAESLATFLRCAVTLSTAIGASQYGVALGPLPFALGQLAYGTCLLLVYLWAGTGLAAADGFSLLPRRLDSGDGEVHSDTAYLWHYFSRPTVTLATSMIAQSVVKHVLTQGDTFLVSILSTPQAQGVYALANNYGGLLARLVFQPIEESSRSYFSRLLSPRQENQKGGGKDSPASQIVSTAQPSQETADLAAHNLRTLLKLYILLSSIVVSIGPVAAPVLLSLVAGRRWASEGAGDVLATYCFYIPLLALNGVSEAFVASVASDAQIHRQSAWMGVFSFAFAAAGFLFLRVFQLGASGLVYANCINMACRIIWSASFIHSYFAAQNVSFSLLALRPSSLNVAAAAAAPQLIRKLTSAIGTDAADLINIVKIGAAAVPFLLIMLYAERGIVIQCYEAFRARRRH